MNKVAVDQLAPLLNESSGQLKAEKNFVFFKEATAGSLQFAESMLYASEKNEALLALLAKGYASYAFVVYDTLALKERLKREQSSPYRLAASQSFSKALTFGFRFLQGRGFQFEEFVKAAKDNMEREYLSRFVNLTKKIDHEAVFYTGFAWLMLANLNRDSLELASQIGHAFSFVAAACKEDPKFEQGLCPTLTAVYHLSRPKILGGKPEEGVSLLRNAMQEFPDNLLIAETYIEWALLPDLDKAEYMRLKELILEKQKGEAFEFFIPGSKEAKASQTSLFNAMATERIKIISALENDLF